VGAALWPVPALLLGLASLLACAPPVVLLGAMVLSVTAQDALALPGGLSLTQAAVSVAALAWAMRLLARPPRRLVAIGTMLLWWLFLSALLLSTAWSPYSPSNGLPELWRWGAALLAWLMAANELRRPWQVALLVMCLLLGPAINAALGLAQFWRGDGPPTFHIAEGLRFVRAYGTLGQPNSFAGYMNHGWPLALALAVGLSQAAWRRARARAPRPWLPVLAALAAWGLALVLIAALGASYSRGAWLGAAVGLLAMLVVAGGWVRWAGLAAVALGLTLLALGGTQLLPAPLAARIASISSALSFFDPSQVTVTDQNFAAVERMAQVWAGWRMWLAHPLLGVGPGSYSAAYPELARAPWFVSRGHAHNYFLHIAAESGIVGLAAYLALLTGVCRQALLALRQAGATPWRWVVIGSCGIIGAVLGHSMFENLHVLHLTLHLAAVWGLCSALAARREEEARHAFSDHGRRGLHRQPSGRGAAETR
jgi:O-antigen ligase